MKEEKSLAVVGAGHDIALVMAETLAKAVSTGQRSIIRQFAGELEKLPIDEIRYVIVSSEINDPASLCELVESTLDLDGGEEYAPILSALEPEEIGAVIDVSPCIFCVDQFVLRHPDDYSDPSKWELISHEQKMLIEKSGDQKLISRISKIDGNCDPRCGNRKIFKAGWLLHAGEVSVSWEAIASYISAICLSERDVFWKKDALEAVGPEMLRYVFDRDSEMKETCYRISPALTDRVMAIPSDITNEILAERNFAVRKSIASAISASIGEMRSTEDIMAEIEAELGKEEIDAIDAAFSVL